MTRWGKRSVPTALSVEVRSVEQLREVDRPAWPGLARAVDSAAVSVIVLPVEAARSADALHRLQVSAASTLGALALHCGGLLVDHGWLRILGGGSGELPDLAGVNALPAGSSDSLPQLVVAYDVLGGVFAIDGGGLGVAPGQVCYRGPDTLTWDTLGAGHTDFVHAALGGALGDFFDTLRWPGWERDVAALALGQGLSAYPPLFTAEGQDGAAVSRRAVPFAELLAFYDDAAAQLAEVPDGRSFVLRATE